jgi:deoxycytidylate deaminase
MNAGITRFLELVFGNPIITPTADEHAMFLAYSASLRSGALGRQVGAVVVSADDDVIAVGANDTPRFGGGQYWPGPDDRRDARQGHDSNATQCSKIVRDIAERLELAGVLRKEEQATTRAMVEQAIRESRLLEITEHGREVHAEMEALLAAARSGGRTRVSTIYTTTFPCHNCAKHIVGAGVSRVVFVEPYPKSKAIELHADAVTFEESERGNKVLLDPFVGVGPRRYLDLFSLRLGS